MTNKNHGKHQMLVDRLGQGNENMLINTIIFYKNIFIFIFILFLLNRFLIENKLIVTNAHVCYNNSYLQVRKATESKKYVAKVLHISYEIDLALLIVDDETFWTEYQPLKLDCIFPKVDDNIEIVGYPGARREIVKTEIAIVEHIEYISYFNSNRSFLTIGICYKNRKGNSGGPVLKDGKVVGIVFQSNFRSKTSSLIPSIYLDHLLEDVKNNGYYTGFPTMNMQYQTLENKSLRKYWKIENNNIGNNLYCFLFLLMLVNYIIYILLGVLITYVNTLSDQTLQVDDVLTHIDNVPITNDGLFKYVDGNFYNFRHLIINKYCGQLVNYDIIRNGEKKQIQVKMSQETKIVHFCDQVPSYIMFAGLVFTVLTSKYDKYCNMNGELVKPSLVNNREFEKEELVLLTTIIDHPINHGYFSSKSLLVTINDVRIYCLLDVAKMITRIRNNRETYIRFGFLDRTNFVFKISEAIDVTLSLMDIESIKNIQSKDIGIAMDLALGETYFDQTKFE